MKFNSMNDTLHAIKQKLNKFVDSVNGQDIELIYFAVYLCLPMYNVQSMK